MWRKYTHLGSTGNWAVDGPTGSATLRTDLVSNAAMSSSALISLSNAQPDPDFVPQISRLVEALIKQEGWIFGCDTMVFDPSDVAAPDRLLPLVMHRASMWMNEATGQRAALDYRLTLEPFPGREYPPLCAAVPELNQPTASLVTWMLYIHHALSEWVDHHPQLVAAREAVPLDKWYGDFLQQVDDFTIQLLPSHPRQAPELPSMEASPLASVLAPQPVKSPVSQPTGVRNS